MSEFKPETKKSKERQNIINAAIKERLMLTYRVSKKPLVSSKSGGLINEKLALEMLNSGDLIPCNDGLFKGRGQTIKLSSKLEAHL